MDLAVCRRRAFNRESFCLYMPHLNGNCFEVFLVKLHERYPEDEIVLVVDRAGAHRKKDLAWPDGIEAMPLPAYSLELNPAERFFEELCVRLSNCISETAQAIEEALTEALRPFWETPERLAQLTGYGCWTERTSHMPTS